MRFAAIFIGVVLAAGSAIAQNQSSDRQSPEDAFSTRELIAWSTLQQPQPVPLPFQTKDANASPSNATQSGSAAPESQEKTPYRDPDTERSREAGSQPKAERAAVHDSP